MHFGAEETDLTKVAFTAELLACVPRHLAIRYKVLPLFASPTVLRLAVADPSDMDALDALTHLLKRPLELCVADPAQLDEFIGRLYRPEDRA